MPEASQNTKDKKALNVAPILVIFYGFVFVCVGIVMIAITRSAVNIVQQPETPRQAYLKVLGETHTGLRLARLNDFSENYARNADTLHARTGRDVLADREQQAWAKLTRTLYNLKSTDEQNAEALNVYKSVWSIWNRQQDLPTLLQATGIEIKPSADMFYAPNARRSKFSKSSGKIVLAGDIPIGASSDAQLDTYTSPHLDNIGISSNYDVQNARIKLAKRPKYPGKAKRKGVEAVVILSIFIDERGNVARTKLVRVDAAKYKNSFARASKRAAMGSKFHPKTVGGKPVATSNYLRQYAFISGG
jgi:Gram-negative bacterial TonB protein C-terminal